MSTIFQVAGMVAIATGAILLSVPVGLIVTGGLLVLIGISVVK